MPPKLAHQLKEKEQEILKKFEDLGYEISYSNNKKHIVLIKEICNKYNDKYDKVISINSITKSYSCYINENYSFDDITLQEHQLLHELFKCWGWIDE